MRMRHWIGADGLDTSALPAVVDRATWQRELDKLRVREKAHTREGDAIAAARRRLPMVEVDPTITVIGPHGPITLLEVFEGRKLLIVYYHMWHTGQPASAQCEGCTFSNSQVREKRWRQSVPHGRTSHRPMVPAGGWTLRRPGHRGHLYCPTLLPKRAVTSRSALYRAGSGKARASHSRWTSCLPRSDTSFCES
jgi:hypothetical protein